MKVYKNHKQLIKSRTKKARLTCFKLKISHRLNYSSLETGCDLFFTAPKVKI